MIVLYGFDGGLAKFGWSRFLVSQDLMANLTHGGVHVTEGETKKRRVMDEDDLMIRCGRLASFLSSTVGPDMESRARGGPKVVFAMEAMSYPPSARGAVMLGMSLASVCTIASIHGIPIVQASPQTLKLLVAGKKSATKVEVEEAVRAKFPHSAEQIAKTLHPKNHEHFFDSCAAAIVGAGSNIVRACM